MESLQTNVVQVLLQLSTYGESISIGKHRYDDVLHGQNFNYWEVYSTESSLLFGDGFAVGAFQVHKSTVGTRERTGNSLIMHKSRVSVKKMISKPYLKCQNDRFCGMSLMSLLCSSLYWESILEM